MNKMQERWDKLKKDREPCPNCGSIDIHLIRSFKQIFKRYRLECWRCHYCAKQANTIRGAIRVWNRK